MNKTLFIPAINEYADIFIPKRKLLKKDDPRLSAWNEYLERKKRKSNYKPWNKHK